jgi:hypothetical protein
LMVRSLGLERAPEFRAEAVGMLRLSLIP